MTDPTNPIYFSVSSTLDADDQRYIVFTSKEFWDENHHVDDCSDSEELDEILDKCRSGKFEQLCESTYVFHPSDGKDYSKEDLSNVLTSLGFTFNKGFDDFVESCG